MTQAARYLFDRCFEPANGRGGSGAADGAARRCERELAAAAEAAYQRGRADGAREAKAAFEGQLAASVAVLAEAAEAMAGAMAARCDAIRGEALQVAIAAAERLARELVRRQPSREIEALFAECVAQVAHAPHLCVHVHAELAEPIRERLAAIAAERGFAGQLLVTPDPAIAPGDGRIEWADGGMVRDLDAIHRSIAEAVQRHLAAPGPEDTTARPAPSGEAQ